MSFLEKLKDLANTDVSDLFKKKSSAEKQSDSVEKPLADPIAANEDKKKKSDKDSKKEVKENAKLEKKRLKEEKKREKEQLKLAKKNAKKAKSKNKKGLFSFLTPKKKKLQQEIEHNEQEEDAVQIDDVNVFDSIEDDFIQDKALKEQAEQESEVDDVEILTKDKDSKTIAPEAVVPDSDSVESELDKNEDNVENSDSIADKKADMGSVTPEKEEKSIESADSKQVPVSTKQNDVDDVKGDFSQKTVISNQDQLKQELSDVESDLGALKVPHEEVNTAVSTGSLIKEGSLLSELDNLITKRHFADEEKRKQKQMKLFTGYQRTKDGSHLIVDDEL